MEQRARSFNKGFTLIEMMISILIIMVSMLALLTTITVSIKNNARNEIRNTAIRVTNQTAEALISLPLEDAQLSAPQLHSRATPSTLQDQAGLPGTVQKVRNYSVNYSIAWYVTAPTSDLKQIVITVNEPISNMTYTAVTFKYKSI